MRVTSKGRMPSMRLSPKRDGALGDRRRARCASTPEMALSVVVLPAPLAPSSVVMAPACTSSDTPFSTRMTLS